MSETYRSGFVAIVGRPNVGKSTFMNRMIGEKIAIMSSKAQTTRNKIQGIYTDDNAQIVFVDTPGIHKPHNELDEYMDQAALSTFNEVDAILFMISGIDKKGPGDQYIMDQLKNVKKPVYLVVNKIDAIHPDDLLPMIEQYRHELDFKGVYPISALEGNNVPEMLKELEQILPEGPQYYPEDQLTDHPEYFVVGELIREKILELTHEEVPHSVAVVVERMKDRVNSKLQIEANIIVERDGQKRIIIGQKGSIIKEIGIRSRREIEALLGEKVNLKLWVKIQKNWRDNNQYLREFGYNKKRL
ncbi:GTPase Era [Latilactobacillus curvatus]|uniref:GTPase Era n=1 Tax=Latilactobacillus curvatus JCM 1096 = DSM 20019 TaxID=1293592 RepID=A0AAJ0LF73_LATCU|nr:GTPase Era [Latilactobacillus curvatus]KRK92891.1 GTP-binding protein Era [Latilactobacillus curvatus JCM 1096 = DSM 20019]MCT3531130.1 GTPase Era [Latilactobacillus curvatus]MDG2989057.1 GTPase Era [Latilactobacillus curvatus]QAS49436.1 GTPase Era [Latilactobacillus curvatus JCM 1096 = DSM 20019]GED82467.1 GTPase Era [Latilactobacillus curvatus]